MASQIQGLKDAAARVASAIEEVLLMAQRNLEATLNAAEQTHQAQALMENTAAISEETAAAAEEVSASSEEVAASVQGTAESAQMLARLAQELATLVAQFKVSVSYTHLDVYKRQVRRWRPTRSPYILRNGIFTFLHSSPTQTAAGHGSKP